MTMDLSQVKIEKNIPRPKNNKGGRYNVLVRAMECGDSVLLPIKEARSLRASICNAGFKSQLSREIGTEDFRVWKLEEKQP